MREGAPARRIAWPMLAAIAVVTQIVVISSPDPALSSQQGKNGYIAVANFCDDCPGRGIRVELIAPGGETWSTIIRGKHFDVREAEFQTATERLFFVKLTNDSKRVMKAAFDGSADKPYRLDRDRMAKRGQIALSPDGTRIALIDGRSDIRVMNADGTEQRLVRRARSATDLAWATDGRLLGWVAQDELWTVGVDESNTAYDTRRTFLAAEDGEGNDVSGVLRFDWSPYHAGAPHIVFSTFHTEDPSKRGLWKLDNWTRPPIQLTDHGRDPVWSPSGKRIAFTGDDGRIYTIAPDGSDERLYSDWEPSKGDSLLLDWEARCTITGTSGDDVLRETTGHDVMCGLGGDDVIEAGKGYDTVFGGPGNDTLAGGDEDDVLNGGAGNDEMSGGRRFDTLADIYGSDRFFGGPTGDLIHALDGTGNDLARAGQYFDRCWLDRGDEVRSCENRGWDRK